MSNSFAIPGLWPTRLLSPWDFPGKNTGVGCHFLPQRIFLTQRLKPSLLNGQADSLPLSHDDQISNSIWFYLCKVPRIVKFIESEGNTGRCQRLEVRCEEGEWWLGVWWGHSFCLGKWTIQMDDGVRCPTMWMYLMPLNCTVKYGWNSMLYIVWLLPQ